MVDEAVGPWWPGRLHVDGHRIETEPLARWWTRFDRSSDQRPATVPGARVYRVGFERRADAVFWVSVHGPRARREFSAPFLNLEKALGARATRDREWVIDRVLDAMSKGRLTRRSLDLAEMWSALCGADGAAALFHFDDDERVEYLRVLESSFEEAFERVDAEGERARAEAILELLDGGGDPVELPGLGRATRQRAPRVTIAATVRPGSRELGIVVDVDGKSKLTLREHVRYQLLRPVPGFEAEAYLPSSTPACRHTGWAASFGANNRYSGRTVSRYATSPSRKTLNSITSGTS